MRTQGVADYTFPDMREEYFSLIFHSECISKYVKISRSESMSRIFRHIAISTHKNVEISRAETMCTFSLVFFAFYKFLKEV